VAIAAATAPGVLGPYPREAHAASFFVTSSADTDDGACDLAGCTLREAINASNAAAGTDFIHFAISGTAPIVITPTSPLPYITETIVLDGTSQSGYAPQIPAIEIDGSTAGPEQTHGLVFTTTADNSMVLGLSIYDFKGAGIRIEADSVDVFANVLGTNAAQDPGHANIIGVEIVDGSFNMIGNGNASERNIISGNSFTTVSPSNGFGVYVYGASANGNFVVGNYIGVKRDGATALPNTYGVFKLDAPNTYIVDNVVSGNERGIHLAGSGFSQVEGNTVGLNAAKTAFVPNTYVGVMTAINTSPSFILENEIRGNGGPGIWIQGGTSTQQSVTNNVIDSNAGLGINLGIDGVTPNDLDDADTGDNGLQNYPVLTSVSTSLGQTTVGGSLNSTPSTAFVVDFYASTYCDASGHGEGNLYLGSNFPTTDAGGDVTFNAMLSVEAAPGSSITATASGPTGVSEFSACFDLPLPPEDDQDFDGCQNGEEIGPFPASGGQRDPENPWDFYDVNASEKVDAVDIGLVRSKFNHTYPPYDRSLGVAPWAPNGPDGVVNATDIALVRRQFNHDCTPDI
jgi:CSLREA domain-containing protein